MESLKSTIAPTVQGAAADAVDKLTSAATLGGSGAGFLTICVAAINDNVMQPMLIMIDKVALEIVQRVEAIKGLMARCLEIDLIPVNGLNFSIFNQAREES